MNQMKDRHPVRLSDEGERAVEERRQAEAGRKRGERQRGRGLETVRVSAVACGRWSGKCRGCLTRKDPILLL